ncbi:MAG: NADH-quinone oxidoreductase subunit NuoK [Planctomycetia bacterium]|jgi:NADH-quinone oxidoreductase subunit K
MELGLLHNYLLVGAILVGIGVVGFLARRNMIIMFLSVEMMLQGISLSLIAWGRYYNDYSGQMMVIMIITIAACEAAIGLALILLLEHRRRNIDIMSWHSLRESCVEEPEDKNLAPEEPIEKPDWPTLPVAGRRPEEKEEF